MEDFKNKKPTKSEPPMWLIFAFAIVGLLALLAILYLPLLIDASKI